MSSSSYQHKSGALKRKEKAKKDEEAKKGSTTLFQFGIKNSAPVDDTSPPPPESVTLTETLDDHDHENNIASEYGDGSQ